MPGSFGSKCVSAILVARIEKFRVKKKKKNGSYTEEKQFSFGAQIFADFYVFVYQFDLCFCSKKIVTLDNIPHWLRVIHTDFR